MAFRLPLEILCEIIRHVELKSDLYNWCLVSRAARDFATPLFYREIWDATSIELSNERRIENIGKFSQLPSNRLENVKKIEIRNRYLGVESEKSVNEMLGAIESLTRKLPRLEQFQWNCYLLPLTTIVPALLQLKSLTSLCIECPMKRDIYRFVENRALEEQICKFQNLQSLTIHGIWTPNCASARRIARVLINSPKLTSLSLSLDELRCEAWERNNETIINEEDEAFWENEEQDIEILDYFPAICREFRTPTQDPSTGKLQSVEILLPTTALLSLTKLELGACCILTEDIHLLTNTSVLEHIYIENVAQGIFASSSPYSFSNSALSALAKSAPKLQSIRFDTFDYDCDATGLHLQTDFPALDSFYVRDEYEGLVEELARSGGIEFHAAHWRRLALGNPEDNQISELDDEFETLLSGLIVNCVHLTHLRVGLRWNDMSLLLQCLTKLPQLREIHLTVKANNESDLQPMHDYLVQDMFQHHPGLRIASMIKSEPAGISRRECWRRRWDGLQSVSREEIHLMNRDGFPRTLTDY
ncbi:hypothetical protein ONS95_005157 [Cadophora gregata]|uniref:uncharacterized protein n=1 Tax=Cadophora gregata TaxID=51156 RepID=UPI0026DD2C5A|nr:uncharacterized protein ONS95_005157 [Cadophora gregata]KAK0104892.1 hypothetical protein ONS95_005157 [Cadophora gregata]